MDSSRTILSAILFAALFATRAAAVSAGDECGEEGACALPAWLAGETNAPATPAFVVLPPVPESAVAPIAPAPRLDTLDGKTIALVGGSFMASVPAIRSVDASAVEPPPERNLT